MYAIKCIWSLYIDRIDYMLQWYAFEVTYVGVVLMAWYWPSVSMNLFLSDWNVGQKAWQLTN